MKAASLLIAFIVSIQSAFPAAATLTAIPTELSMQKSKSLFRKLINVYIKKRNCKVNARIFYS